MSKRADDDSSCRNHFRTQRIVNINGNWYFLTREGTQEGPFSSEMEANRALKKFIDMVSKGDVKVQNTDKGRKIQQRNDRHGESARDERVKKTHVVGTTSTEGTQLFSSPIDYEALNDSFSDPPEDQAGESK